MAAITPEAGFQVETGGELDFGGVEAEEDPVKDSTSETVILPSGPVPVTWERSMPFSAATFLARGEATTLPPEGGEGDGEGAAFELELLAAGAGEDAAGAGLWGIGRAKRAVLKMSGGESDKICYDCVIF